MRAALERSHSVVNATPVGVERLVGNTPSES